MPVKHFTNSGSLADGPGILSNGFIYRAGIFKVDKQGFIKKDESAGAFLLNPSTYEETKTANWAPQNIPGQSDPILQWISSGPRTITFDALVTNDTSNFDDGQIQKPGENSGLNKALSKIGDIASAFFKVTVPAAPTSPFNERNSDTLDISNMLNYYRSLLYPIYDRTNSPRKLRSSPPLVVLVAGNTFSSDVYERRISNNQDVWVVTNLRIKITKQTPNLSPLEALVSFSLTQYTIKSFSGDKFNNSDQSFGSTQNIDITGVLF